MALEIHNVRQSQKIDHVSLFDTLPRVLVEEIAQYISSSESPEVEAQKLLDRAQSLLKSPEKKRYTVTLDTAWKILGTEDEVKTQNRLDGFQLNSIERILAYITLIVMLTQCINSEPEKQITINNYFIEQYEEKGSSIKRQLEQDGTIEI